MPDADWNDPPQADIAIAGDKIAGIGREEGIDELLSYTEVKTVHVLLGEAK